MKFNLDVIFTDTEFKELKEYLKLCGIIIFDNTPNKFTDKIKEHFKINLNLQSWYFIEYQEGAFATPHKHEDALSLISTTTLLSK